MNLSPPAIVITSFGLDLDDGEPVRLGGGQGTSFLIGDAVIKPEENIEEVEFVLGIQDMLAKNGNTQYRIPQPLRQITGAGDPKYIVDGWIGAKFVRGTHMIRGRWSLLLDATRAFHKDLRDSVKECPSFIERRTHRWARADRIVWEEIGTKSGSDGPFDISDMAMNDWVVPALTPAFQILLQLRRPLVPGSLQPQLVHSDLYGNMLYSDDDKDDDHQPPAIIDLSLYWRPVEYAEAVIVADAMVDCGEGEELISLVGNSSFRLQMLVKALLFRILAWSMGLKKAGREGDYDSYVSNFERAVGIVNDVCIKNING
jgi:hypothetical protein